MMWIILFIIFTFICFAAANWVEEQERRTRDLEWELWKQTPAGKAYQEEREYREFMY